MAIQSMHAFSTIMNDVGKLHRHGSSRFGLELNGNMGYLSFTLFREEKQLHATKSLHNGNIGSFWKIQWHDKTIRFPTIPC